MDFSSLGHYLKDTRENQDLTLEDAVRALRVRRSILEAFELGNFNVMESQAQVRGILRSYARYLGLDEERVLAQYENAQAAIQRQKSRRSTQELPRYARKQTDTPPALPAVSLPERRSGGFRSLFVAFGMLLLGMAALGVILVVIVDFLRTPDENVFVGSQPTQNPMMGTLVPTFTFTPTWTPRPTQPTATMPFTGPLIGGNLTIDLNPTQRVWVRVTSDGTPIFAGILRPNEAQTYTAVSRLDIVASNAAALDIVFNGQPQGRFGLRGQEVALVFTSQGIDVQRDDTNFQPTPEFSPTPPPTPTDIAGTAIARLTPTATDGPSPTPSLTLTPSITPSITPFPTGTPSETPTPTPTLTPTTTLTPSSTPTATATPTITLTPTNTVSPTPTAVLPLRITITPAAPAKEG
jgi:transcriptional regulator with XRE-family HTH domain